MIRTQRDKEAGMKGEREEYDELGWVGGGVGKVLHDLYISNTPLQLECIQNRHMVERLSPGLSIVKDTECVCTQVIMCMY